MIHSNYIYTETKRNITAYMYEDSLSRVISGSWLNSAGTYYICRLYISLLYWADLAGVSPQ